MRGIVVGVAAALAIALSAPIEADASTGPVCFDHSVARKVAHPGDRRVVVEHVIAMYSPATAASALHVPPGRAYYFSCDGVHHLTAYYAHSSVAHPTWWVLQLTRWERGTIYV